MELPADDKYWPMFKLSNDDRLSFFALKWRPHLCAGWEEEAVSGEQLIVRVKPRVGCAVHLDKRTKTLLTSSQAKRIPDEHSKGQLSYIHCITPLLPQSTPSPLWAFTTTKYTHRVATATFWRKFHHDGKISPAWWGWRAHHRIQSWGVRSRWEGRYTPSFHLYPYMYSVAETRRQPNNGFVSIIQNKNTLAPVLHQTMREARLCIGNFLSFLLANFALLAFNK